MSLINCKVELITVAGGIENPDTNSNNIFCIIKVLCLCSHFISKRQSKFIKTFYQRISK